MEYPKWKYKPAGDSFEGRIAVDPDHEDALDAEGFTYSSPAEFGVVTCPGAPVGPQCVIKTKPLRVRRK